MTARGRENNDGDEKSLVIPSINHSGFRSSQNNLGVTMDNNFADASSRHPRKKKASIKILETVKAKKAQRPPWQMVSWRY